MTEAEINQMCADVGNEVMESLRFIVPPLVPAAAYGAGMAAASFARRLRKLEMEKALKDGQDLGAK